MKIASPIEQRLLGGLAIAVADRALRLELDRGEAWPPPAENDNKTITIYPQVPLDGYRIDFVVHGARSVAVECDGHAFHERTKEQAQHDKARDRRIQRTLPILRFTGSEIHADPLRCAEEVLDFALAHREWSDERIRQLLLSSPSGFYDVYDFQEELGLSWDATAGVITLGGDRTAAVDLIAKVKSVTAQLLEEGEVVEDRGKYIHPHDVWQFDPEAVA